jgi:hypothetical protein
MWLSLADWAKNQMSRITTALKSGGTQLLWQSGNSCYI